MATHEETKSPKATEILTQAAPITSVDEDARTCVVVFSTGDLIPHWVKLNGTHQRMMTRVQVSDEALDLDYLQRAGPVLDSHSQYSARAVLGCVDRAWVEAGQAKAEIRFTRAEDVEPIWQRVADGALRNVSMGFVPIQHEITQETIDGETVDVMLFTLIRPTEISMVAIGADSGAHVQVDTQKEEATMAGPTEGGAAVTTTPGNGATSPDAAGFGAAPAETNHTQSAPDPQPVASQAQILQAERARQSDIRQTGATLNVPQADIETALCGDVSADDFRRQAVERFAADGQAQTSGVGGPAARVETDGGERFIQGATLGVMMRAGMPGGERNEFTGMTLSELARQSLVLANAQIPQDRQRMIGVAFTQAGSHSTSDFANVLGNLMGKAALNGWEEAEETYQRWTMAGTLTDFKPTKRVGLGLFGSLPEVPEGAEYTYGTVGDRGETIQMATYGRLLRITRQAIINDDLQLFTSVPSKMGRAARRTIGNLVYKVLTDNPTMSDGNALFDATAHANAAASGGAPSVATFGAGRAAMRTQKEKTGGDVLNIAPAFVIVPAALETATSQLLNSAVDPTTSKGQASNPVAGLGELIVDGRLDATSATAWYLAANPMAHDTIEVAYLDGITEPWIEEKTGWTADGVELKVRIDAAVAPTDWRGLYRNAGA